MTEERPRSDRKKRTCLKCGKLFDSTGPGNRICKRCAQINARIRISEEALQKQRGAKRHNGDPIIPDPMCDETTVSFTEL